MIPNTIVIHHTASGRRTSIAEIDAWHKAKWGAKSTLGFYIGYHYVIDVDGNITQTRRDNEMGIHCPPNDGKIGVCLIGNFMEYSPTDSQVIALDGIVKQLMKTYNITKVGGHRDWIKTECPGDNCIVPVLQNEVNLLQYLINKIKSAFQPHA